MKDATPLIANMTEGSRMYCAAAAVIPSLQLQMRAGTCQHKRCRRCFSAIPFRSFTPPSRPAAGHSSIWKSASLCSPSHVTSDIDSTRQACILQICQDDKPLAQVTRSSQNKNTVGSCQPSHDTGNELHACIGSMIDLWVEPDRAIGPTPPGPLGLVLYRKHRKNYIPKWMYIHHRTYRRC